MLYLYNGWQVWEERENDQPRRQYIYGGQGIDDVVIFENYDTTAQEWDSHYYSKGVNHNTIALTDANGVPVERYLYDPYGKVTFLDGSRQPIAGRATANPYLFQSRRLDEETGLYYYRNRYYCPDLGRFLQRDPLGYVDGMNLYEFVGGRPVVMVDPMGLWSWRNADDVYIIQTILNNNAKRFGLNLGNTGPGNNGIDGSYGPKTRAAVCKFQRALIDAGCPLPQYGADGLWGAETTRAFTQCETDGRVNWRYAHIRVGVFGGVGGQIGLGSIGFPGGGLGGSIGVHANMTQLGKIDPTIGFVTFTASQIHGVHLAADINIVLAWNIFNAGDWRSLSSSGTDWGIDVKIRLPQGAGRTAMSVWNVITFLTGNKDNLKSVVESLAAAKGNAIWRGEPGSAAFGLGVGGGAYHSFRSTNYRTDEFAIGN